MKIISDFKDYYDAMRAYGEEPGCLYQRYTKVVGLDKEDRNPRLFKEINQIISDDRYSDIHSGYIAFCGKIYPMYTLESFSGEPDKHIYSIDQLLKYIDVTKLNPVLYRFFVKNHQLNSLFNEGITIDEFLKHDAPVFAVINKRWFDPEYKETNYWHKAKLIINPKLSDFAFQQIVDPYQCWQQISQFITNELNRDTEPTQVGDDKIMIITKGFDPITSFRSGKPGEKKVRRKENKKRKKK